MPQVPATQAALSQKDKARITKEKNERSGKHRYKVQEEYQKTFGVQCPRGQSVRDTLIATRLRKQILNRKKKALENLKKIKNLGIETSLKRNLAKKKRRKDKDVVIRERVIGCSLDEQAKELKIFDEAYAKSTRKKRKVLNHLAYKEQSLNKD